MMSVWTIQKLYCWVETQTLSRVLTLSNWKAFAENDYNMAPDNEILLGRI